MISPLLLDMSVNITVPGADLCVGSRKALVKEVGKIDSELRDKDRF